MRRVKKTFLIFVFLLSLLACTQKPILTIATPTFTPYVGGTQTSLAGRIPSPTPSVEGPEATFTPPSIAFPTFTPSGASTPGGTFSPLFYGSKVTSSFLLIGGMQADGGWLSAQDASAYVSKETNYDLYGPQGILQMPGGALEFSPTCQNYFMHSPVALHESMVGVASGWTSRTRTATELSPDNPSYVQAVKDWFQAQGTLPTEIHLTHILQTDIEGDGIDEILLSASYFKDPSGHLTETGDYSIVLMRKAIGNQIITIPLVKDYYVSNISGGELSYPNTYRVLDTLDLNRDGRLEVIVGVARWEGLGALIYQVDGQNIQEVLRAIC